MSERKSKQELEIENAQLRDRLKFQSVDRVASIILAAIPWVGIAFVAYEIESAVSSIAGRSTKFSFSVSISVGLAVSGLLNFFQFLERGRVKRQLSAQLDDCKKKIDPKKQTSGLSPDGSTHPGDKL